MSVSAFVVEVPAAESAVSELRSRFDATAKLGVPAHITVLFPFMAPDEITAHILRQAQSALSVAQPFRFALTKIGRFATTTYLSPVPPEPFVALTTALVERFPMFRPYGGAHDGVVPHLTVAHGGDAIADFAAVELERRLCALEPIRTECNSVTLLGNTSGRWKRMHVFDLPKTDQQR
ncbi:2'-5' RNA ligase family protein [Paraburkholderia sp. NMBU_R16]|uniref:2'-5' RNA ligase family protein n=1 Tax=Paraburkholderia sp. NMBU_R16 TaxID=2698676 RepID=UPI0015642E11|nr:2'-5' RNA ligase family protein [Paraburkholderia sp. NMBU_R16]NRO99592.1 2'-5' RNA ligase family protein [Paraburkholderia sp. NMBU_R16]